MTRRQMAWLILLVWLAAVGWLVRREYFRPHRAATAEGALLISPSAQYFKVLAGDRQVGFASTTVDTSAAGFRMSGNRVTPVPAEIRVEGVYVTEQPLGGRLAHTEIRTNARLSRLLQLQSFSSRVRTDSAQATVFGFVIDDTTLIVSVTGPDSLRRARMPLTRPLMLTTLMPLRLVFGREMAVGNTYDVQLFDPIRLQTDSAHLQIVAESTFVVADSARHDSLANRWYPARTDTVRTWQVSVGDAEAPGTVWIDELGQVVRRVDRGGFVLERLAFELAFENFRKRDSAAELREHPVIVPGTMLDAGVRPRGGEKTSLTLTWTGGRPVSLSPEGHLLAIAGDTVRVTRANTQDLVARYRLPADTSRDVDLAATFLIQRDDPDVQRAAREAIGDADAPPIAAERLVQWVSHHLKAVPDVRPGFASRVLRAGRGDASQLASAYVAMARAIGLPARTVGGLIYIDGRYYLHAWAEVHLGAWVPVDPTLGQFPADAAHVRLVTHGLARPLELTPLVGAATITTLGVEPAR